MSPRRQPEPTYIDGKTYPARDAQSFAALAPYFREASRNLRLLANALEEGGEDESASADETGAAINIALAQAWEARRLWVEFVTRHQYKTQREIARLLNPALDSSPAVTATRVNDWRYDPLDTSRLTRTPK